MLKQQSHDKLCRANCHEKQIYISVPNPADMIILLYLNKLLFMKLKLCWIHHCFAIGRFFNLYNILTELWNLEKLKKETYIAYKNRERLSNSLKVWTTAGLYDSSTHSPDSMEKHISANLVAGILLYHSCYRQPHVSLTERAAAAANLHGP